MAAVAAAGAAVASFRTVREAAAERKAAEARQREDFAERRDEDSGRYTRDLLRHATEFLIDALWTRERTLCDALDAARNAARDGLAVGEEPSATLLGELDLAVKRDLLFAAPFIASEELRGRVLTAQKVVNDAYNIRCGSMPEIPHGGTYEHFSRAMIEVQRYFQWLRWNLACAVQGQPLPPAVAVPEVLRVLEPNWAHTMWEAQSPPPSWA